MTNIKQTQIAQCLKDYYELTTLMTAYPNAEPYLLFEMYLTKENRQKQLTNEYYQTMINIAYIFIKMKMFSIAEDYTLKQENNFINNKDLNLEFLNDKITGNKAAISNKKLLKMLRDGFNHTTEENELYKITSNGEYIEFSFKKPSPLTIKLNAKDITKLIDAISDTAQTFHFFTFNKPCSTTIKEYVENLCLKRYYFPKKVDKEKMVQIFTLQTENKLEEANNIVNEIENVIEKEIPLSKKQQKNFLENVDFLIPEIITLKEFTENLEYITLILLNKELPIPILKQDNYLLDSIVIGEVLPHKVISYETIYTIFTEALKTKPPTPNQINKYMYIFNKHRELVFKTYFANKTEKDTYAMLLFAEYIITNFIPDKEFIEIDEQIIEYKKLRNSLVHSRWCIEKNNIVFYDSKPKTESELNYNWSITLSSETLSDYCKNILNNKLEQEKEKPKQKILLESKK